MKRFFIKILLRFLSGREVLKNIPFEEIIDYLRTFPSIDASESEFGNEAYPEGQNYSVLDYSNAKGGKLDILCNGVLLDLSGAKIDELTVKGIFFKVDTWGAEIGKKEISSK